MKAAAVIHVFIAAATLSCAGSSAAPTQPVPTPTPIPAPPAAPTLLRPEEAAVIPQNNPESGCAVTEFAGAGTIIEFDWDDVAAPGGLSGYHIRVQRQGAAIAIVSDSTTTSGYIHRLCGSYIADQNLQDWVWAVRAVDRGGQTSAWVERTFSFTRCRVGRHPCGQR